MPTPKPLPLHIDPQQLQRVVDQLIDEHVSFIRFEQSDTHGISRSKTIPVAHFKHFAEDGLNFLLGQLGFDVQGGVAPGTGYLEERGFPDSHIFPDLSTVKVLPWATLEWEEEGKLKVEKTARVLCEPYFQDNTPAMAAPRAVARTLLNELASLGFGLYSGFEYECYFVNAETHQPPFTGIQIFSTLRNNFDPLLVSQILREMPQVGVDIITSNAEYGPGQMEINFGPSAGIEAADNAFTFKAGVKEIAVQNGYMASFMTKPYADQSANGCHYHHSLVDLKTGKNAFAAGTNSLNDTARWWLGGQIKHAAAFCAFASPTINCYKRYKLYSFAPTNDTWGIENRTVGVRVKGLGTNSQHFENRFPGAASNPYLVMAACVAAGLDGIRNKIEPPPMTEGIAYGLNSAHVHDLPTSLPQALNALESDTVLRELLGEEEVKLYLAVKRHEIQKAVNHGADVNAADFRDVVTPFETDEYFEFL